MDLETLEDSNVIKFPVATVTPFSRNCAIWKERSYLIILASALIAISSLSAALFIVGTVVYTPDYAHVESTVTVKILCCFYV